ncbi:ABC transporter substrate-binding protein [Danxiaibacter flavus]|uniref:ABC transporter substrate-binding protein n=1 Tax=Danxiaibacter flavus TaxID=3049108 RepID=A0ABV3ZFY8_9BACT|nr:ABC transporter substrate-binding protein [Chitinophagaceae bacterium DXS]
MESISVGVLLPSSTILPISKDFEKGLKDGLKLSPEINAEIVKEFIGQGSLKQTEEACNKFFNYHDVDIITGIVSSKVMEDLSESFKTRKKSIIINNLGGHIPNVKKINEYIFVNSMHLWQHAFTMGKWGVQTLGKKGMFVSSIYDAGYSFSQMFNMGMTAGDPESKWSFSVTPMPAAGELADISVLFPFIEKYEPDFIFATFCGKETTLFLNEFINRGWHHKIKVTGLPFLTAPFEPLQEHLTVYSTLPVTNKPEYLAEKAFYDLGYTTGVNIAKAALASDGTDLQKQLENLHNMFSVANNSSGDELTIVKYDLPANGSKPAPSIVTSFDTFDKKNQAMQTLHGDMNFGWANPYLCI